MAITPAPKSDMGKVYLYGGFWMPREGFQSPSDFKRLRCLTGNDHARNTAAGATAVSNQNQPSNGAARSIGQVLAIAKPAKMRRTHQPVRRNSFQAGRKESQCWRPLAASKRDARKIVALRMKAAEIFDRQGKQAGKRNGPLGHIGLEVMRALYSVVDYKSGRLEPSIDWICGKIKRSRAAVVSALARLKHHGFLDWIRRTEPVDNDGAGPQVRQITNAYWFGIPAAVAGWIKSKLASSPIPDDEAARQIAHDQAVKSMLDGEGFEATARYVANESPLGARLISMGASLDVKLATE